MLKSSSIMAVGMPGRYHRGMDTIKTAIIGCGRRSRLAASPVLTLAGFRIIAVADPSAAARAASTTRHPGAAGYADHQELLDRERPAAVFVTSPDHLHTEHACAALRAGAAVYLEKPLAITAEDADRILATAMACHGRLYVGHNMRHFPCMLAMKRLIDEGAIGRVQAAWCRHFIAYGGDAYYKDWHADRRRATGLLLQKGAHDIDVLHWLCGARTALVTAMGRLSVYDRCPRRAVGEGGDAAWSEANWPPLAQRGLNPVVDVEDHSMVLMQLANGVQCSYQQCHYTPDSCRNYTVIGDAGRIENHGDSGTWEVHLINTRRSGLGAPDRVIRGADGEAGHGGADERILAEFAAFVRDGAAVTVSAVGARDAALCCIRATESLRDGSRPRTVEAVTPEMAAWFARAEGGA